MAIPGPVTSAMSVGAICYGQIGLPSWSTAPTMCWRRSAGCRPASLQPPRHYRRPVQIRGIPPTGPTWNLPGCRRAFLTHEARTIDDVVTESGLSPQHVLDSLVMLDLRGLALKAGSELRRLRPSDNRSK